MAEAKSNVVRGIGEKSLQEGELDDDHRLPSLMPEALVDVPSVVIAVVAFLVITLLKADVALVAVGAMATGIAYATLRALL